DATVAIENINWHLEQGKDLEPAILEGADQIAVPAFVSTLCICIVFVPMFFLTGVARYLFVPMAEAVVFAMLASYVLSRTLVPTMAKYLLKAHEDAHAGRASRNPLVRAQQALDRGFMRLRDGYRGKLAQEFPGVMVSFIPADIVTQILNFGLPAPIDVQIVGRNLEGNRRFAAALLTKLAQVPGMVDLRVHQAFNQPLLHLDVDRTRAMQTGFTQRDVANNLLISLSGSAQ